MTLETPPNRHHHILYELQRLFDKPIMEERHLEDYAKHMILDVLGPTWSSPRWCIHHVDGTSILAIVKSAFFNKRIMWSISFPRPDIYLFAYHHEKEESLTNHRNPAQWEFYIVPANKLFSHFPHWSKMGMSALQTVADATSLEDLPLVVYNTMSSIKTKRDQT